MTIGERIQTIRQSRGMTQEELAEKLGTTQGAMSQWEKGLTYPSSKLLADIAAALGCTVDALYSTAELADPPPYDIKSEALRFRIGRAFGPIEPKSLKMSQLCAVMWLFNRFQENSDSLSREEKQYMTELLEHCIHGFIWMQYTIEAHGECDMTKEAQTR